MKEKLILMRNAAESLSNDTAFLESVEKAKDLLIENFEKDGIVLICGNGGSATQASHMVGELVGRFGFDRPALPAFPLFDLATTTAVGNDYGYDHVFSRFVDGLKNKNTVLISISTSGNSGNCLKAMESAKARGMKNVALLGKDGGKMKDLADVAIVVPESETPLIQEIHLMVIHHLCGEIENHFFGEKKP